MAKHSVLWASPQPLWGRFGAVNAAAFTAVDQRRPALLRFASDEFMQQTLAILEHDPRQIGETLARPETWRNPSGDAPNLAEPVRLPRRARGLARLMTGAAAQTAVATTTHEQNASVNGVARTLPLKLYHPAHQRHYLVAANLVCGVPGFPDRGVNAGGGEQVSFMLRRILPESDTPGAVEYEYAFVKDGRGPHWERVPRDAAAADPFATTVAGEEMLPLFPLNFRDDVDHPRRILAGLIPVGRREEYMSVRRYETPLPPPATPGTVVLNPGPDAATRKSARKEQFKMDVSEPWKALIRASYKAAERISAPDTNGLDAIPLTKRKDSALAANEGAQHQSWLILLDLADYLFHHVRPVWEAVMSSAANPTVSVGAALFTWLNSTTTALTGEWQLPAVAGVPYATTMRDALRRIGAAGVRDALEASDRTFVSKNILGTNPSWPKFYYLLAGVQENPDGTFVAAGVQSSLASPPVTIPAPEDLDVEALPQSTPAEVDAKLVDKLVQLVMGAIDANATTSTPPIPFAAQVRDAIVSTKGDPGWFVIRCAYVRCDCGSLDPTVMSEPSQRFQLASFFDSDAPARPIRIALPIDTTAAGMRKHQKNTAFVMSDVLCGQVNRLKGLGFVDLVLSVLPWPFHKDLDIGSDGIGPCNTTSGNLGMICSLSIPIITICALILLFMIVLVLDIIFKWIPWFIICFPLPGFKAKKATP